MRFFRFSFLLILAAALSGWVVLVHHLADQPLGEPRNESARNQNNTNPGSDGREAGDDTPNSVGTPRPSRLALRAFTFASNEECEPCHKEIFDEWYADQHSQSWFNRPLLPQDPKRTECSNCHAPKPILETGITTLPVVRADRYHEGVGCIECHVRFDHVEGPRPSTNAACNPRHNPEFTRSVICSSCHAPHGSFEEWKKSAWAEKGYSCQACHMKLIDAPSITGGPPQRRRSHRMLSQRNPEFLRGAVTLQAEIQSDSRVEVRVSNTGTGHNVPGEIYNRELFLSTSILDADGSVRRTYRESFKTVRREKRASEASTQLRPGETRRFTYDLEIENGKIKVLLAYKLLLFHPDAMAFPVHEQELDF